MTVTLDQIFTEARTARGYLPGEVPDETLRALYDLVKFGPTSGNCTPLRIAFALAHQLSHHNSHGNEKDRTFQPAIVWK